jgi:hypothetical protein
MAQSRARPLSAAETALAVLLAYLVLLISLAAARLAAQDAGLPTPPLRIVAQVSALTGTVAPLAPFSAAPSCVGPRTISYDYARSPGITESLAFGPAVEPAGPQSAAAVNGVLIQRLCGGPESPGGPVRAPDRRLFAAIDAAVNGTNPNRQLTRAQWAAGVDRLVTRDGRFVQSRVVTRTTRAGTGTYGMRVRAGDADPLVISTHLAHDDTSRYLVLPVKARDGRVVTLTLRLRCGFQPVF